MADTYKTLTSVDTVTSVSDTDYVIVNDSDTVKQITKANLLDEVTTSISENASNIATNATNIATNTTNIATNASDISDIDTRVTTLEGGTIATDTTLTVSGMPADAKAVGIDIDVLKNDTERTIGYLVENLYPARTTCDSTAIAKSGCTVEMSGATFVFTATSSSELYFGSVATTTGTSYSSSMGPQIAMTEGDIVSVTLDSNFTKNFVTFFDENDTSLSWQRFTSNSFNVTAPSDTSYMVLRIGISSVTSGTSYSTTITVTERYDSVVDSTANKDTQYAMFEADLIEAMGFVAGGLNSAGAIYTGQAYRVSSSEMLYFDEDFIVTVPSDMSSGYCTYDDTETKTSWVGWYSDTTYTIPANTYFRLQNRRATEDTSETVTDTDAFLADFTFALASNLTDLEERVEALEEGLPDYYSDDDYLDGKLEDIHDACSFLNGVVFAFITDLHFDSNALNSKYLLKEVLEKTSCSIVIGGGDYATMYGTQDNLDDEYQTLLDYAGYVGHSNWFSILGNHDFYNVTSSSDSTRHSYTWGKTYNGIFRNSERWQVNSSLANGYYCIDNEVQSTRIIMLNSCEPATATYDYTIVGAARVKNAQLQWLYESITELSNYKIIVISHIPSDSSMTSYSSVMDPVQTMLEAFVAKTSFSVIGSSGDSYITGDFSDTTNELICHISGHGHVDESITTNDVLSIATTCDAYYTDDGYGATVGTITEQAFDVFCIDYDTSTIQAVRLGRGSDRSWNY